MIVFFYVSKVSGLLYHKYVMQNTMVLLAILKQKTRCHSTMWLFGWTLSFTQMYFITGIWVGLFVSNNIRQEFSGFIRCKVVVYVKLHCFQNT